MIYLYSGTPGSGKSLFANNEIRFQLNRRTPRPVIANFELAKDAPIKHPDMFHYLPNSELTAEYLTDFATDFWNAPDAPEFREEYLLIVLDEVQLVANSRNWAKDKNRMELLEFLSQHRKYGYKIIMIAQAAKMIDNQFRMLIEYEVNHRRLQSMGLLGGIVSLFVGNRVFCRVTYLFQSQERLSSEFRIGLSKDMRMYDSRKTFAQIVGNSA